jgi:hypothetical protein
VVRSDGARNGGGGGVDGATHGTAAEVEPGHGGHEQGAVAHVTSRDE